jgi:hypothetical protein
MTSRSVKRDTEDYDLLVPMCTKRSLHSRFNRGEEASSYILRTRRLTSLARCIITWLALQLLPDLYLQQARQTE